MFVLQWSRISDHIGRKPVLLIGTAGLCVSMICFGLSKTFWGLVVRYVRRRSPSDAFALMSMQSLSRGDAERKCRGHEEHDRGYMLRAFPASELLTP